MRKLSNNLQVFDVAWVLPKGLGGFVNAKVVTQTLHNFWASIDQCVGPEHVPHKYKNTHGMSEYPSDQQKMVKWRRACISVYIGECTFFVIASLWKKRINKSLSLQAFAGAAQKLWDQMVELKTRKERVYNMIHDGNHQNLDLFDI